MSLCSLLSTDRCNNRVFDLRSDEMRNAARRDKSSWTNDDNRRHPDRSKKNTLCTSIADVFSAKINEHSRFRNLMYPSGPNFPGLSEIQATQLRAREERTSIKKGGSASFSFAEAATHSHGVTGYETGLKHFREEISHFVFGARSSRLHLAHGNR